MDDNQQSQQPKQQQKPPNQWHILEGLKNGHQPPDDKTIEPKPPLFTGYILKRRKRPLKGWHKRYFHLDNGILSYAKNYNDWQKQKLHGSTDIGLSVISCKPSSRRIDIDSDSGIFHLKAKKEDFNQWVHALRTHRLARQHEIAFGGAHNHDHATLASITEDSINSPPFSLQQNRLKSQTSLTSPMSLKQKCDKLSSQSSLLLINQSNSNVTKIQEKLVKLSSLIKFIETTPGNGSTGVPCVDDLETYKCTKKLSKLRRFHLHRSKNKNKSKDLDQFGRPKLLQQQSFLSVSHPSLTDDDLTAATTNCANQSITAMNKNAAMKEFVQLANEINNNFRHLLKSIQEIKYDDKQDDNNEERLKSIQTPFDKSILNHGDGEDEDVFISSEQQSPYHRTYSMDETSVMSISEYHDAEDNVSFVGQPTRSSDDYNSSSSSSSIDDEDDDDESIVTDFSEDSHKQNGCLKPEQQVAVKRRTQLPSAEPTNDISLWSLLRKNIGKDLSKISMPVTINEPLNLLQRLCEELEYCELLDMAAAMIDDPCQRMLMMAAFAISSYSSSYYRVGHKPFNPLLGETYECVRDDKGFRFIGEQVSHHPPISACHADSKNYVFWQDMRVKTKFWGKSMEIIPIGTVNVILRPSQSHYQWNKITTCVHNLFKGERYVDIYGELTITEMGNDRNDKLTCKITFDKASYWSSSQNEIHGMVMNNRGQIIERIRGRWNESVYVGSRCIWRVGTMPDNYEAYYGFTRFAIELNELLDEEKPWLPPTDTRFRPDQRALEEGDVQRAETIKSELEQQQRERRKMQEMNGETPLPLWFRKQLNGYKDNDEADIYIFNNQYWDSRAHHFDGIDFARLW
ncbi:oxysterol-binding protein-related protein 3-like [Dermatophagoides pteronyssinus]|uniref:oxysterol-binding protein-related protein 3-like n=1 Tax=Dermatophagoides pteronyssinus TaxID=6956 RepID=UPI003F66ACD5